MARPAISVRLRLPGDHRMRRVLAAYGLCDLVEFATWMAVLLVAFERGGATLVGVAAFAMLVPAIFVVPLVGGFGDRMPRGRALSLAYVLVAASSLLMAGLLAADAPFWSILLGGAMQTIALSLVQPMHYAALPFLSTRPGDLVAANGLSSFMDGVTLFLGFAAAGVLSEVIGPWVVLLVSGLAALTAALLTARLGIPRAGQETEEEGPGEIRAALEGITALRGNWGALALLALLGSTFLVDGANEPLSITLNAEVLDLGDASAGLLAGAYGIGLALGGATQAGIAMRRTLGPIVLAGSAIMGLSLISVALLGQLATAFLALTACGIGASMVIVSARTLLQRSTDNLVLARVLAVQEGVKTTGQALGSLVGPLLIFLLGASVAFIPVGLIVLLAGLLSFRAVRRLESTATVRVREAQLLAGVPFLSPLAPYELEHLAQSALWRRYAAGTDVVRQGDEGDAFFVVAQGELSITVDGRLREHTLGAGDGFGEIALLHQMRRTATVTTLTDCELLMVDMAQFLAALTASADGTDLAREVSEARLASDRDAA